MRKKLLILLTFVAALCATATYSQVYSGYLEEGFESTTFPPTDWQRINVAGTNQWVRSIAQAKSGVASAQIAYQTSAAEDWLILPKFAITSTDKLRFWMRLAFQGYSPDALSIRVSTTDALPASFTTQLLLLQEGVNYPPNATTWNEYEVDLSAYAGQEIYVAFRHTNNNGDGLYLDDITVGTMPDADVAVQSFDEVAAIGSTGTTPKVTVKNNGGITQSFIVNVTSTDGYTSSATVTDLAAGATQQLVFANWTPAPGLHTLTATAVLAGDTDLTDNTLDQAYTSYETFPNDGWISKPAAAGGLWANGVSAATNSTYNDVSIYAIAGSDASFAMTNTNRVYNEAAGTWTTLAPIPVSRMQISSAIVGNKIYMPGGYTGGFSPTNRLDIYDIATDTWSQGADMPTAVGDYAIASYNDTHIYVIGGYNGSGDVNTVQVYNIATNTWTVGTPKAGTAAAGLRGGIANGKIVVAGGYNQSLSGLTEAWLGEINTADPTQITWTALPALPIGKSSRLGGGALFERVYFTSGDPTGAGNAALSSTCAYNVLLNQWELGPEKITGVSNISNLAPFLLNEHAYLVSVGGYNGVAVVAVNEWLDLGNYCDALDAAIAQTNVSCIGSTDGSITVTPSGGHGDYAFSWNTTPVQTTPTISNLAPGDYTVTITSLGCTITRTITITEPAAVSGTTVVTNVSCNGGSNGSINLTPTGGTGPYTFNWVGGITTEDRTGLAAGSYSVTITDANGCTGTVNATVTQPAIAISGTTIVTNIACNGGTTGAINLTPTGGTGPYTYNWTGGVTTEDRTGLAAGSYSVTITDANGCTGTVNATVTQPAAAISGTTVVTNVACNGGTTGAINLTPTGGTGPYTFNWGGGITTEDRTGLAAGSYSVTITDANGCTGTVNVTVTQPAVAVSGTTVVTNVACNGGSNGSINLTPTGGTGPYTYNWGGGITTEDRTGLAAGSYAVIITDANGCTGIVSVNVTQPASPVSGTIVVNNVACNGGSNGSINLTPTGGTGPYTYNWTGGVTTEDRTGLAAGSYSVTITDANGCTGTVNATVTQPAAAVSGTAVVTNVACNGGANGAINLTATGGTAPYTFNWSGGITTEDRTGLAAGSYSVTITDANGCTATVNATVTQPALTVSGTTVVTNVACNGGNNGAINLTPTGGTGPYTFNWGGGITTEDRTGLAPGSYSVVITDVNGCMGTVNATVTQPAVALSGTTVVTNVACNGGSNGAINLTPTGGTGPYTFNWGGGITTEDRTGLAAGSYSVIITDANGCTGTVNATVTQPAFELSVSVVVTNVACNGSTNGSINLTPMGGTAPYTFNWDGGITTEDRTGLAAGNYSVTITDANGCTNTQLFTITEPTAVDATAGTQTSVSCNGGANGSATVNVTGGTGAYTYNWDTTPAQTLATATGLAAGTYTVTVTDANGCTDMQSFTITEPTAVDATAGIQTNVSCNGGANGSATVDVTGGTGAYTYSWNTTPAQTSGTATGLMAGTYTVTVTDANGCTDTQSFIITEPTAVNATAGIQTNVSCNGGANGSATVNVTGGTGAYTYSWNTTPEQTSATAIGLAAGAYTVTVTDANGCTDTQSFMITEPAPLAATLTVVDEACLGSNEGAVSIAVSGGTAPYSTSLDNLTFNEGQLTYNNLPAGSYTIYVTDAAGCVLAPLNFELFPGVAIDPVADVVVNCIDNIPGNIVTISVNSAVATDVQYSLDGVTYGTSNVFTNLSAGNYTAYVQHLNGCIQTTSFTINAHVPVNANVIVTAGIACYGGTGEITLSGSGGTGALEYAISPDFEFGAGNVFDGLVAGTYTFKVRDALGCETQIPNIVLWQPDPLIIVAQPEDEIVLAGESAQFTAEAVEVTGYQWQVSGNNGATWINIFDGGDSPQYSGTTTNTLSIGLVHAALDGYLYRVIFTYGPGCTTISETALLTVENVIEAVDDDFTGIVINEGVGGMAGDVTENDLFNGAPVDVADITITLTNNGGLTGVTIDNNGNIIIPASATEGTYILTYTICEEEVPANCSTAQVTVVVLPLLKVDDVRFAQVSIYPNPAHAEIFIEIPNIANHTNAKVAIYDTNGRLIKTQQLNTANESVDVRALEDGVYLLEITSDLGKTIKRFVKKPY